MNHINVIAVLAGTVVGVSSLAGCVPKKDRAPGGYFSCSGNNLDLQGVIDAAPPGSIIDCHGAPVVTVSKTLLINKPLTLIGLSAKLSKHASGIPLLRIAVGGVHLYSAELRGNYSSDPQQRRASLVLVNAGPFYLENLALYESSKDGIEVSPPDDQADVVGGLIRNVSAWRIGRDAVSLSGGPGGRLVRDILIENVRLQKSFFRGAVEVSDGTDNIRVRGVSASDSLYAVDVQDRRSKYSSPNTNVFLEDIKCTRCQVVVRTRNSKRGHHSLSLKNLVGADVKSALAISNTKKIFINGVSIVNGLGIDSGESLAAAAGHDLISFKNCRDVRVDNVVLNGKPVLASQVSRVDSENVYLNSVRLDHP